MKPNQLYANDFDFGKKIIIKEINRLLEKKSRVVVAIDGMAASGKTTMAKLLQEEFDAEVVHLDDYFLQDYQRTETRLNEVGGNVDYERFFAEIVNPILEEKDTITYNTYNCQTKRFKEVDLYLNKRVIIVEGAYALREEFRDIYDLKVLITINSAKQIERLEKRNAKLIDKFVNEWIPKEYEYIEKFRIRDYVNISVIIS